MNVRIENIIIPDRNAREDFNEESIRELSESIAKNGLINPVTLRNAENEDTYELIAGERRLRAYKLLGLEEIEARVVDVSDEEAEQIMLAENLERQDLNPYEEAKYLEKLVDRDGIEEVSNSVSRTRKYINSRLNLLSLCQTAVNLLVIKVINIGHALQLSKLNEEDQKNILGKLVHQGEKKQYVRMSPLQLKNHILTNYTNQLGSTNWDKTDPELNSSTLVPCTTCPERSGYNKRLFFDISQEDICYNRSCFKTKSHQHCVNIESKLRADGTEVVRLSDDMFSKEHQYDGNFALNSVFSGKLKKAGVYFSSASAQRIGRIVEIVQGERLELKKGLAGEREKAAKEALENAVLKELALKIAKEPRGAVDLSIKIMGAAMYKLLSEDISSKVAAHYGWKEKNPSKIIEYCLNVNGYGVDKLSEVAVFMSVFNQMRSAEELEKREIFRLARSFNIDVDGIEQEVEKRFQK